MAKSIAIVGGGPKAYIPELKRFDQQELIWIGADQGAEVLLEHDICPDVSIGDFDSVDQASLEKIKEISVQFKPYPNEKDETDLELAINQALNWNPEHILLFGVTGGRIDHSMANLQLLYPLLKKGVRCTIRDHQNQVELAAEGEHTIKADSEFPYVSFLPMTLEVTGLTLQGFYYPLQNAHLPYGSTLCVSNCLIHNTGTFSFRSGILLVIRSKDLTNRG